MKLVVGLGNPGVAYEETKHNLGFWVVNAFANDRRLVFSGKKGDACICRGWLSESNREFDFLLAKPQTYMNLSGHSVRALLDYYKISRADLILIYDDVDLEIGRIRLKKQGSAGGHRGVASVIQSLGSNQFIRLKVGVGRDPRVDTADYVLSPFRQAEKEKVLEAVDQSVSLLPLLIEGKLTEAMNRFNRVS